MPKLDIEIAPFVEAISLDARPGCIAITCRSDWAIDDDSAGNEVTLAVNRAQAVQLRDWLDQAIHGWGS